MAVVYDDNFGFWDIDGPEESAFFKHVQRAVHAEPVEAYRASPVHVQTTRAKHAFQPNSGGQQLRAQATRRPLICMRISWSIISSTVTSGAMRWSIARLVRPWTADQKTCVARI
jgi:hypothetical protein